MIFHQNSYTLILLQFVTSVAYVIAMNLNLSISVDTTVNILKRSRNVLILSTLTLKDIPNFSMRLV